MLSKTKPHQATMLLAALWGVSLLFATPSAASNCRFQISACKWRGSNAHSIATYFGTGLTPSTARPGTIEMQAAIRSAITEWNLVLPSDVIQMRLPVNIDLGSTLQPNYSIVFTYGKCDLGELSQCTGGVERESDAHCTIGTETNAPYVIGGDEDHPPGIQYARTSLKCGNGTANMMETIAAHVDFNPLISYWTTQMRTNTARHELGHVLGLAHIQGEDGCPDTTEPYPLMYAGDPAPGGVVDCDYPYTLDYQAISGVKCLYGGLDEGEPCQMKLGVYGVDYGALGGLLATRTYWSSCNCFPSYAPAPGPAPNSVAVVRTFHLAIQEGGGPFEEFAVLAPEDWVDNHYDHVFGHAYTQARVRLQIQDDGSVVDEALSERFRIVGSTSHVGSLPDGFEVAAFPNPFVDGVSFAVRAPEAPSGKVLIHDVSGREIRSLELAAEGSGWRTVVWDGTDTKGQRVRAGVYYYTIHAGGVRATRSMIRLP